MLPAIPLVAADCSSNGCGETGHDIVDLMDDLGDLIDGDDR